MALNIDMANNLFQSDLFLEDEDDFQLCKNILHEWFPKIQICFTQGLAETFNDEPEVYPRMSLDALTKSIADMPQELILEIMNDFHGPFKD